METCWFGSFNNICPLTKRARFISVWTYKNALPTISFVVMFYNSHLYQSLMGMTNGLRTSLFFKKQWHLRNTLRSFAWENKWQLGFEKQYQNKPFCVVVENAGFPWRNSIAVFLLDKILKIILNRFIILWKWRCSLIYFPISFFPNDFLTR